MALPPMRRTATGGALLTAVAARLARLSPCLIVVADEVDQLLGKRSPIATRAPACALWPTPRIRQRRSLGNVPLQWGLNGDENLTWR